MKKHFSVKKKHLKVYINKILFVIKSVINEYLFYSISLLDK